MSFLTFEKSTMLFAIFLLVLCLDVLGAQLQDPIDDIITDLEQLNKIATIEQTQAINRLGEELSGFDKISEEILINLEEDLIHDTRLYEQQIHALMREARDYRVDISECIGDELDQINKLPERYIGEAGVCANLGHAQAEQAADEGVRKITEAVGPIDIYWSQVQRCREADDQEQEICIAELQTEILNDKMQIPSKIHLAVQEVIGHLEAEKAAVLLCADGKLERLNDEGRYIVQTMTECAEHLFPTQPTPII